jgi:hypothetical protein
MQRCLKLFATLFAVPTFGLLLSFSRLGDLDHQFVIDAQAVGATDLAQQTLAVMCQIADARELAEQDCYNYDRLITLRDVSLFMVIAALLMIAAISVAARFAERDRRLLAALFIPGVHLTLLALLVMIVAQSLIAAYAFYTVETELARSVGVALIYCLILSAVLGAWGTVRVGFAVSRRPPLVVLGIEINQETQGRLWRFVAQVASKLGAEPPAHIVLGLQPTFYATPANLVLVGQSQVLTGDTILCRSRCCAS